MLSKCFLFHLWLCVSLVVGDGDEGGGHGGIRWHRVGVNVTAKRSKEQDLPPPPCLLHMSSFHVPNGHVCGVIGPSGSGKSTLLAALAGTKKSTNLDTFGSVWLEHETKNEGVTVKTPLSFAGGEIAMLQQHDSFFAMLTPRETVALAAYLQLQDVMNATERRLLVDRTLESLGLTSSAMDRPIGDPSATMGSRGALSGGERRRLSAAVELVTSPKVFLADEATTGLDSTQAKKVMTLISKLAKERNIPCICSIHQPRASIWKQLDSFILLAPGGKICYMGPRDGAREYFAELGYVCPLETNPAEYFIDLVSIDSEDAVQRETDLERINFLASVFQARNRRQVMENKALWTPPLRQFQNHNKVSLRRRQFFHRMGALVRRAWRQNIRNVKVNLLRLGTSVGQALLFSQIFPSVRDGRSIAKSIADRTTILTFGVVNMSMMAVMKTLDLFGREKPVVNRERMRRQYSGAEYLLSKALAEVPIDVTFAAAFATVLKLTTQLRTPLAVLAGAYSLMTVAGASLGFAIGSLTDSVDAALSVGVPVTVVLMAVGVINPGGVDPTVSPSPIVLFLKLLSPIRWSVEAVCVAEFRGMLFERYRRWGRMRDLPRMGALSLVKNGNQVLDALGLGNAIFPHLMANLVKLSAFNLFVSWLGLTFGSSSVSSAPTSRTTATKTDEDSDVDVGDVQEEVASVTPSNPRQVRKVYKLRV